MDKKRLYCILTRIRYFDKDSKIQMGKIKFLGVQRSKLKKTTHCTLENVLIDDWVGHNFMHAPELSTDSRLDIGCS
jgi:hypothetical protein